MKFKQIKLLAFLMLSAPAVGMTQQIKFENEVRDFQRAPSSEKAQYILSRYNSLQSSVGRPTLDTVLSRNGLSISNIQQQAAATIAGQRAPTNVQAEINRLKAEAVRKEKEAKDAADRAIEQTRKAEEAKRAKLEDERKAAEAKAAQEADKAKKAKEEADDLKAKAAKAAKDAQDAANKAKDAEAAAAAGLQAIYIYADIAKKAADEVKKIWEGIKDSKDKAAIASAIANSKIELGKSRKAAEDARSRAKETKTFEASEKATEAESSAREADTYAKRISKKAKDVGGIDFTQIARDATDKAKADSATAKNEAEKQRGIAQGVTGAIDKAKKDILEAAAKAARTAANAAKSAADKAAGYEAEYGKDATVKSNIDAAKANATAADNAAKTAEDINAKATVGGGNGGGGGGPKKEEPKSAAEARSAAKKLATEAKPSIDDARTILNSWKKFITAEKDPVEKDAQIAFFDLAFDKLKAKLPALDKKDYQF